jgi:hypothetical protein
MSGDLVDQTKRSVGTWSGLPGERVMNVSMMSLSIDDAELEHEP